MPSALSRALRGRGSEDPHLADDPRLDLKSVATRGAVNRSPT
ncbi:hypothetical protein FDG2_5911 [Candidatus Protofrankia californiensis]|uniref:Uncharacterized protein n=1 Tax=Candidatus Protofrankia californiensis TaxID=1839754 RepID=A0A1C3PFW4_9ACTN|nr:hypothetical protein FDG2_5911 [Candidatus Protofrankia californiensis]